MDPTDGTTKSANCREAAQQDAAAAVPVFRPQGKNSGSSFPRSPETERGHTGVSFQPTIIGFRGSWDMLSKLLDPCWFFNQQGLNGKNTCSSSYLTVTSEHFPGHANISKGDTLCSNRKRMPNLGMVNPPTNNYVSMVENNIRTEHIIRI